MAAQLHSRDKDYPARFLDSLFARPHLLLRFFAFVVLLLAVASVLLMLRTPVASFTAEMGANGAIDLESPAAHMTVPSSSKLSFHSRATGETIELPASLLPGVAEPRGNRAENAAYWDRRDRLANMLKVGSVEVDAGDSHMTATARARTISDLTAGFWLSLIAGSAAALAGAWVWILRPRDWAPAMFALSGAALFVGCATTALNVSPGLAFGGGTDQLLMIVNYISGVACAGALAALFARFPVELIRPRWLALLALINLIAGIIVAADAVTDAVDAAIIVILLDSVGIVVLLGVQAWQVRRMGEGAAGLLPIAVCTGASTFLFCVLSLAGQIAGGKPLVMPDMTAPLLFLIYLGLGVAITRSQLFSLGRWALSLLLSACAILMFIVVDAVVLGTLTQQRDLALFVSGIVGVCFYLPAREWLLRRVERLREQQASDLLELASDVALAPSTQAARDAWRNAATRMFNPLEVSDSEFAGGAAEILHGGRLMYLPAPDGRDGLLLQYAAGGARIFTTADLETADTFSRLARRLADARDAYVRGASEERTRIARDLHDDVGARLLTSLHREEPQAMRDDVREAMADIRTIITGLVGKVETLEAVLARLRYESDNRLMAAGIALKWDAAAITRPERQIAFELNRHLSSIVREYMTNIIRHAGASRVTVEVRANDAGLAVAIKDDGSGFDATVRHGEGMLNAARRAESLGGSVTVRSSSAGTEAVVQLPLCR